MTAAAASERHPVEQLAEDFVTRYRRGERPSLTEYVQQYPDVSGELVDIIQALLLLEDLGANGDAADECPPAPERLGEYRIIREIGRGGMGVVYEAEQGDLGRRVALKVLPAAALLRPTHLERFRREARAAARLHHTNIIPVHGVGSQDGIHFYAMQYIPGRGLDEILAEVRKQQTSPAADTVKAEVTPLTGSGRPGSANYFRAAARIARQIADALAHAHGHGVLHRDVKPANVVLDESGTAWLGDFGLAHLEGDQPLTSTGGFVGTLRYLAPERFRGEGDARSDIYSLGATLYELLTLRPMFDESDRPRLIRQVTLDEPPPPRKVAPGVPKDLETVVLKATAKNPADRYATATGLADDLRRFLADRPVAARRASRWELTRRWIGRNPTVAALLAAVLTTLTIGFAATWRQWRRAEDNLTAKSHALEAVNAQRAIAQRESDRAWRAVRGSLASIGGTYAKPMSELRRDLYAEMLQLHAELAADGNPARRLDRAVIARGLGEAYFELREIGKAKEAHQQSVRLTGELAREEPARADVRFQHGQSLFQYAKLLAWQQLADSEAAAGRAIAELRSAVAADPAAATPRIQLALALRLQGRLRRGQKRPDLDLLTESNALLRKLQSEFPRQVDIPIELSNGYLEISKCHLARKQSAEARAAAGEAVNVTDALLAEWPERCDVIEAAAHACEGLGAAHFLTNDVPGSLELFRRGVALYRALVRQDPQNPSYNYSAAASLHNLAKTVGDIQDPAEGHRLLDESTSYLQTALTISPRHAAYLAVRNSTVRTRIMLYQYQQDHRNVARSVAEALKILPEGGDQAANASDKLLTCVLFASRDAALEVAERARLMKEYREQAVAYLRTAAEGGYANTARMQRPPFLALRNHPEFTDILSKITSNAKAAAKTPANPIK